MSDNNKFSLRVGYIQLNIIKHALQHYLKRPASKKEKGQEKRLLEKVRKEIGLIKQQCGIYSKKELADIVLSSRRKYITNGEKLRSMNDKELAKLISSGEWSCICPFCKYQYTGQCRIDEEGNDTGNKEICTQGALEWINSEVEEDKPCLKA